MLSNELEALKIYIEMESLRFNNKFTYNITLDKEVGVDIHGSAATDDTALCGKCHLAWIAA